MRPLKLRFQAFGAYPGLHEVDFEVLGRRGLFLVTGPTGTGKSTVFDAMVFALYGDLPGARAEGGEARSHYVGPEVDTFVEFEFETEGQRYRIRRTPLWFKPPKKDGGNPIKQTSKATLARLVGGGTEPVADQPNNVTDACKALVGLESKQFQRVVLLPQGEFTKFLLAKDADRQLLLRELFDGKLYDDATRLLRTRWGELEERVHEVDGLIEHHRTNAVTSIRLAAAEWSPEVEFADDSSLDVVQAAADRLAPVRAEQQRLLHDRSEAATEAERNAATASQAAERYDQAEALVIALAALVEEAEEVEALRQAVEASKRGASVVAAADLVVGAEADLLAATEDRDTLLQQISGEFSAMAEPMPEATPAAVTAAVTGLAAAVRNDRQLVKAAADAEGIAALGEHEAEQANAKIAAARAAFEAAEGSLVALTSKLAMLEPVASAEPVLTERERVLRNSCEQRSNLEKAMTELPAAEAAAKAARDRSYDVMSAFIATQAPRLAAELVDGEPCSVCGSTSHPRPAQDNEADVVDHDQVEVARQAENAATTLHDSVKSRIETLRGALGQAADEAPEALRAQLAEVVAERGRALAAATEAERLQPLRQAAERDRDAADGTVRSSEVTAAQLAAAAHGKRAEAERLAASAAAVDLARLDAREQSLAALGSVGEALGTALQRIAAAESVLTTQRTAADTALSNSGFASVAAGVAAVLEADAEREAANRVDEWDAAKQSTETKLGQLREQGVPQQRPDAEAMTAAATQARRDVEELAQRVNAASIELDRTIKAIADAQQVGSESIELRAERDDALVAFRTCNGEAGMGVKLERWVLAAELERVTQAANVHLARMSNGRFRLGRKEGRVTLEIEVFDSNTGRARATSSLSGGEQFQASLSLALGLADVVSHGGTASGRTFEALFVDEGFGSLDPKALDQAIEALLMIQAGGRMVGAITHVEGMKERLHTGIEVSAREDGKGSTLKVNP